MKRRKQYGANVIVFPSRSARFRSRRPGMQPQQFVTADVLSFALKRRDNSRPMAGRNTFTLFPFAGTPGADTDIGSHVRDRHPARKKLIDGHHNRDVIRWDYLSRQQGTIRSMTDRVTGGTMCPMGRGSTPVEIKRRLGERVKSARVAAGYTNLKEFARLLGSGWESYRTYERGRTPIPHELIPRFCELTGRDANYLFDVEAIPLPAAIRQQRSQ